MLTLLRPLLLLSSPVPSADEIHTNTYFITYAQMKLTLVYALCPAAMLQEE